MVCVVKTRQIACYKNHTFLSATDKEQKQTGLHVLRTDAKSEW